MAVASARTWSFTCSWTLPRKLSMKSRLVSEPPVAAPAANSRDAGDPRWYCGTAKRPPPPSSNEACMSAAAYGPIT